MTVSCQGVSGGRSSSQSKAGSITTHFGIAAASSSSSGSRSASSAGPGDVRERRSPASQRTAPSIAFAYGSIRSFAGLKRWPCGRVVGPVDAVAVALAGPDAGQVAVPVERRALASARAASRGRRRRTGTARRARRARRRARSSCPRRPTSRRAGTAVPGQTLRESRAGQSRHRTLSGDEPDTPSGGSVSSAEHGCSCHGTASASTPPSVADAAAAVEAPSRC